jgi:hypothetical protein
MTCRLAFETLMLSAIRIAKRDLNDKRLNKLISDAKQRLKPQLLKEKQKDLQKKVN